MAGFLNISTKYILLQKNLNKLLIVVISALKRNINITRIKSKHRTCVNVRHQWWQNCPKLGPNYAAIQSDDKEIQLSTVTNKLNKGF